MKITVSSSVSSHFLSLDWWSNPYVGAHWIACKLLPENDYLNEVHHGPMAQLLLIASHQLVELMLFQCINESLKTRLSQDEISPEKFNKLQFFEAFSKYPQKLGYKPFNTTEEPFKSIDLLRIRRNDTIHKDSKLVTNKMARSALYTAVQGSIEIAKHFRGENGFPYWNVLEKYPIPKCIFFSEIIPLERYSEKRTFPKQ